MKVDSNNRSSMIRNYAVAGFFVVLAVIVVLFFLNIFALMLFGFGSSPINVRSECREGAANVFVGANQDLKNVSCVALDKEWLDQPEIVIGDLSKNDEDVCRFNVDGNTTMPLRFEVRYNGEVKREVCDWQHYSTYID